MRNILASYVMREILLSVSFVCAAFIALFSFFDLIGEVGHIGKGEYTLARAILYVFLLMPVHLYEVAPIAVLIGTLYTLALLAARSEMVVMRISGVSPGLLWRLLIVPGVILAFFTILVGEFLSPEAERLARELKLRSTNAVIAREFRSGLWLKSASQFVNVRVIGDRGVLEKVRFFDIDTDGKLRSVSEAESGRYVGPGEWHLTNVARTSIRSGDIDSERVGGEIWGSDITPDMLTVLLVAPERMSIVGLYKYVQHLSQTQQSTDQYEIAFWRKIVYPFACFVMMALALPISYIYGRVGGVGAKIFVGIMTGVAFHVLSSLSSHIGLLNSWYPSIAAIVPSLFFLGVALFATWWTERR